MADGGLTVLDGTQLRAIDPRLPNPNAAVNGATILHVAESIASSSLFGLSLPDNLKSSALKRINADAVSFSLTEFHNEEEASSELRNYIIALADELKGDPLVVSVLDGSALRLFLEDEDDFAMLAESLFTDLDTKDTGKLSKNEIRNALIHMGVEMGVPPFEESGDLLDGILKKHNAEGEEELGQAQFAQLLQHVLQDLADALAKKHVVVIQNIKVINGSKLRKVLSDEAVLNVVIERMFQDQDASEDGKGSKDRVRTFLEKNGPELGLPPSEANEAVVLLYDQIFAGIDIKMTGGKLERNEFGVIVKDILEKFAEQLEANPIFHDLES
ncbi:calcium-binding EF hand family protein [Tasmannia lanceolata]|uniref:calcium-binding EF hand family protein n=1 Tax=Tasmannia lanceolata TaxID=3420 RepID=UPI004064701F